MSIGREVATLSSEQHIEETKYEAQLARLEEQVQHLVRGYRKHSTIDPREVQEVVNESVRLLPFAEGADRLRKIVKRLSR